MQTIVSDNGSPIVSSIRSVRNFMNEPKVKNFLTEKNIKFLDFVPYPARASFLGGFVENLVKQVKKMINASLSNTVLSYEHFCLFIKKCKVLVNKRPIGCQRLVTDQSSQEFEVLTPEMLIYGRDIPVISVIPQINTDKDIEYLPIPTDNKLFASFHNLCRVKQNLEDRYHGEFIDNLRTLSVKKPGQYKKKETISININDLVTIKSPLLKPFNYPFGLVQSVELNDVGDPVSVKVRKSNGEVIRRHISDIILLEKSKDVPLVRKVEDSSFVRPKSRRIAALRGAASTRLMLDSDLV